MPSDTIFKIINLKQVSRALTRKQTKLNKRSIIYKKAVIVVDRWIQKNFDKSGKMAMGGSGWKPLAPSTIRARAEGWGDYKKMSRPQILRARGTLKRSWKSDWNNRRGIIESYATGKGSTYYYGYAHHEGKGNLPERRILPKEKQIMPQIRKLFGKWIKTSLK